MGQEQPETATAKEVEPLAYYSLVRVQVPVYEAQRRCSEATTGIGHSYPEAYRPASSQGSSEHTTCRGWLSQTMVNTSDEGRVTLRRVQCVVRISPSLSPREPHSAAHSGAPVTTDDHTRQSVTCKWPASHCVCHKMTQLNVRQLSARFNHKLPRSKVTRELTTKNQVGRFGKSLCLQEWMQK